MFAASCCDAHRERHARFAGVLLYMRSVKPRILMTLGLFFIASACGNAPGIGNNIETIQQRIKRQEAEDNATPDIKGVELRKRLYALGVKASWIKPVLNENDVEILELRVPKTEFAKLDHRAIAKLVMDSRYRFNFVYPDQVYTVARFANAELKVRDKAKALQQLAERGQLDSYPQYHKGMAVSVFAPKLEAWCGYHRGQALRVIDGNWVDYQHEMVDMGAADTVGRAAASFDCMKRVVDASTEFGRRFIGNRGREGAIDY